MISVGEYLIERLHTLGVKHVFGVPGDFVLGFYDLLAKGPLQIINTCDEQGAGFAADAYARVNGLGVVCITYCVGGFKVINTTAEAYAEKSPVIVISGSPGINERFRNPLLHHKVREFDTQKKVFEQVTAASTVIDNPETAQREIDRVIATALLTKRPVYIELPRDMVSCPIAVMEPAEPVLPESDPRSLKAFLEDAMGKINGAKKPVILAGVEVHRFGLQDMLLKFVKQTGIPVAATILGKSVVSETEPFYLGVYEGAMGQDVVRNYVETSDCVIILGAYLTDINMGIFTARLDPEKTVSATSEKVSVGYGRYEDVTFPDVMAALLTADIQPRQLPDIITPTVPAPFQPEDKKMTVMRLFQRLNSYLKDDTIVVCDVGDALFGAIDLVIHLRTEFLCPAYYTSIGFGVPAGIGAQLARPSLRPLILVGDGAFQMTGVEISTMVRFGLNPVIVILNNQGYATERPMRDGTFNDILNWRYEALPELLGAGKAFRVETEQELENALAFSETHTESYVLLNVILEKFDFTDVLHRIATGLAKNIKK